MKNGKIEFARFVFAIVIMFFHIGQKFLPSDYITFAGTTFFKNGWFGVEFFFVVSGYLMASAALKKQNDLTDISKDTFRFLSKKIFSILPFHIIVFFVSFIYCFFAKGIIYGGATAFLVDSMPNFFLVQRSGLFGVDVLGVEWYISDMLISMLLCYPLCLKNYKVFSRIIAPATAIFLVGYLIKTTGSLNGSTDWSVFFSKTFLRAVSEICAGVFTFEVCRNLKKLNFTKKDKLFLTVVEVFSYYMIILFIVLDLPKKYSGTFLIFICLAVMLSFSNITYGNKFFNNKFVFFLGKVSLPLYLCQSLTRLICVSAFKDYLPFYAVVIIFTALTFVYSFVVLFLSNRLKNLIGKKINNLSSSNTLD